MRRPLSGSTAIITGADGDIGAAAAHALSNAGASVVLAADGDQVAGALAAEINSAGGHAVAVPTDVTNPVSVRRLVEQTLGAFGRLDAAVNNAVRNPVPTVPFAELPADRFDTEICGTMRGLFLAMKYEILSMSRGGRIVNVVSAAGTAASSLGMIGLTRAAAHDYAESGVRINAVAAGPRPADEIANAVLWLCSDGASFVTGETFHLDRSPAPLANRRARLPS